jgi:hypothetical protein
MSLRHAICSSFYLQDLRSTCFLVVAQCIALSMFVSVMYLYVCLFAVAKLLLFPIYSLMFPVALFFYHNNLVTICLFHQIESSAFLCFISLCSVYIGSLKSARSATRFLWIEALVMVVTVQMTLVHLSITIIHCRAFQRHVLPPPCFVGTLYCLSCMWGATHTDVTFNLSFLVPAILSLKIESAFINTIVMSDLFGGVHYRLLSLLKFLTLVFICSPG